MHASARLDLDGDQVDSPGPLRRAGGLQVVFGGADQPLLLPVGDRLLRAHQAADTACANLHEYDLASILRDNVYLAATAAVVARHNLQAGPLQPAGSQDLTGR